jgi:hypothetical protein
MKIYRLTSSFHLQDIIESDDSIQDNYHTSVELPKGLNNPRFINGLWIDETEEQKKQSIKSSGYDTFRAAEYPPMSDYLDGLVKGDQAQIDAYIAACLAVKAKYPKEHS